MPRIVDAAGGTHDYCRRHMPTSLVAHNRFAAVGPLYVAGTHFQYHADHPDYDGARSCCELCGAELTGQDN